MLSAKGNFAMKSEEIPFCLKAYDKESQSLRNQYRAVTEWVIL